VNRRVRAAILVFALASACDDGDGGPAPARDEQAGSGLASAPLRAPEIPDGLEPAPEGTGPIGSIREVLPPRRRFPNLPPLPEELREAFRDGYRRAFASPEVNLSSTVVRLADSIAASAFLAYLRELPVGGNAATAVEVPATGLGEEGYGWHLEVPGSESSGFTWRTGDLVATITMSGPIGEADPDAALPLAERVDGRLG